MTVTALFLITFTPIIVSTWGVDTRDAVESAIDDAKSDKPWGDESTNCGNNKPKASNEVKEQDQAGK